MALRGFAIRSVGTPPPLPSGFSVSGLVHSLFSARAAGFGSIHPKMEMALRDLGIGSDKVTQGWGSAAASAGYHEPVGWVNFHQYSTCVDLSASLGFTAELKSHLVAAGFAPFFRDWAGNRHIHCVYVGDLPLLAGPKQQVMDYTNGLDGLVDHAPIEGVLAPTPTERDIIRNAFATKVPHVAVDVLTPSGARINCYSFVERFRGEDKARCELSAFLSYFGAKVIDGRFFTLDGKQTDFTSAIPVLSGQFTRVNVTGVAACLGLKVASYNKAVADGSKYTLKLARV